MSLAGFTGKLALNTTDYDSTGLDLGVIESYEPIKEGALDPFEYPDTDARDQEYYDSSGAKKEISITGCYIPSDGSWATLIAWKEAMEGYLNGYIYDQSIDLYLCVYIKDYYGSGLHLWLERNDAALLETNGEEVGLDVFTDRLAMNEAGNIPICVTISSLKLTVKGGTSPTIDYTITLVQRLAAVV
jgi:hypothetical protein